MNEVIVTLIRQVALVYGTYLVTSGKLDPDLLQPWIGAILAFSSVGWMVWDRFIYPKVIMYIVTKDDDDKTVVIKTTTKDTPVPEAIKLLDSKTVVTSTKEEPITVITNSNA